MMWEQINKQIEAVMANFDRLSQNMALTAGRISDAVNKADESISKSVDKIKTSLDDLNGNIKSYSESSDRQASAMKWLTAALVVVGVLQVIIPMFQHSYSKYTICEKLDNNQVSCQE